MAQNTSPRGQPSTNSNITSGSTSIGPSSADGASCTSQCYVCHGPCVGHLNILPGQAPEQAPVQVTGQIGDLYTQTDIHAEGRLLGMIIKGAQPPLEINTELVPFIAAVRDKHDRETQYIYPRHDPGCAFCQWRECNVLVGNGSIIVLMQGTTPSSIYVGTAGGRATDGPDSAASH